MFWSAAQLEGSGPNKQISNYAGSSVVSGDVFRLVIIWLQNKVARVYAASLMDETAVCLRPLIEVQIMQRKKITVRGQVSGSIENMTWLNYQRRTQTFCFRHPYRHSCVQCMEDLGSYGDSCLSSVRGRSRILVRNWDMPSKTLLNCAGAGVLQHRRKPQISPGTHFTRTFQ